MQQNKGTAQKVKKMTMTSSDSRTYTAYITEINDSSDVSEGTTTEFAGLASADGLTNPASDVIEYEGWLALEEEPKASVNWNDKSCTPNIAVLSVLPGDHQSMRSFSLETHPFYCDTGATVHISPDKSNFYSLHSLVTCRTVKGVGGSSISAIGIGNIKLCIAPGAHLTLKDVLYILASTVRLMSISTLTHDSKVRFTFGDDEDGCWISNKSTGTLIARGQLTSRNLYSLNLQHAQVEHVLSAQYTPDLETWHHHLRHANYQSIIDMTCNGTINGVPSMSTRIPPKCDSCILGKQMKSSVPK